MYVRSKAELPKDKKRKQDLDIPDKIAPNPLVGCRINPHTMEKRKGDEQRNETCANDCVESSQRRTDIDNAPKNRRPTARFDTAASQDRAQQWYIPTA
jgi:hypothetical protein